MNNLEKLRKDIDNYIDPSLHKPLHEVNGVIHLSLNEEENIINLEIALKNKRKDETQVKLELARLIKLDYGFNGVRFTFVDSTFKSESQAKIKYLGIISGKGGVGKSSVAANLAVAFSLLGKRVGIIDADVYGSSLPSIFKLPIEPLSTSDNDELIPAKYKEIEVISPEFFMPKNQPLMWRGPMLGKLLTHFFDNVLWGDDIELVLVDLPPGTGDIQLDIQSFVPNAKMLLVTTPHPNASHVALKAGLGAREIGHDLLGVVENMSYYYNESSKKKDFLFGEGGGQMVADTLKVPLLMQIPINQPLDKDSHLYSISDMNGKLYYALAKQLVDKI